MEKIQFDCVVIGSGPGGYVAAIRAAQKGFSTALIEDRELGGVCLNRGCIPSKTLIANAEILRKVSEADLYGISTGAVSFDYGKMKTRKDTVVSQIRQGLQGLITSNKIQFFQGFGKFVSPHEIKVLGKEGALLEAKNCIIATGSVPRALPNIPFDYHLIHDSTSLLDITKLPKRIVIVGGGVIGCEFASLYRTLGVDVTIIELLPMILSTEGKQVSEFLTAAFKKQGIQIETGALIENVEKSDKEVVLKLKDGKKVTAECVLVSVGRKYNVDNIGLDRAGVSLLPNGAIGVNDYLQTNAPHIYAIGDVTGKWILAHVASHQGMVAVENIAKKRTKMHYTAVPSVIFTKPEIGTVGYTLERAKEMGYNATVGKFPFQALGKSQAIIETEGFAQIVTDKKTGQLLGAQVVGYNAATLVAEMTLAMENELVLSSVHNTIHAHPTLSEAWLEAALMAQGTPLHLPPRIR